MRQEDWGLTTRDGERIPLVGVTVRGEIVGRGARVTVTQVFRNEEGKPVEAVYKFPLPEKAAICGFRAWIGQRLVEGRIEERDKGFELYDEAMSQGDGAYLLDEERPNVFTLSVGNLNPGSLASVEIDYVILLDTTETETRFMLPTTISPRYVPKRAGSERGIPTSEVVNPPICIDVPYGLSVYLKIHDWGSILSITSPSHQVVLKENGNCAEVSFASESVRMDRDFVLTIKHREQLENRAYAFDNEKGTFLQVDLKVQADELQPADSAVHSSLKQEVIFLLDCSGSMIGNSIEEAKKALEAFLRGLEEGTKFNIYRFGSQYERFCEASIPLNQDSLEQVVNYIRRIAANMGGTEVLFPLKEIKGKGTPDGYEKVVILITDGQVGNEAEVVGLFKGGSTLRIFTVGIGYSSNEYFIRQLARTTRGSAEFIAPGERIEPKILRLFKRVVSPKIEDLQILHDTKMEQAPSLPVLFSDEGVSIMARITESHQELETVTITGRIGDEMKEWKLKIEKVAGNDIPIPQLWAREKIRDLEEGVAGVSEGGSRQIARKTGQVGKRIIDVSKDFSLLSRETSFVAVETRSAADKTVGGSVLRRVPVMLTEGWGGIVQFPGRSNVSAAAVRVKQSCFLNQHSCLFTGVSAGSPTLWADSFMQLEDVQEAQNRQKDRSLEVLMTLLSHQRAEGGFQPDGKVEKWLGISKAELDKLCEDIEIQGKTDRLVLLATAIVLSALQEYFVHLKDSWDGIVQKSVKWFQNEVSRTKPQIGGISLETWADQWVKNLGHFLGDVTLHH